MQVSITRLRKADAPMSSFIRSTRLNFVSKATLTTPNGDREIFFSINNLLLFAEKVRVRNNLVVKKIGGGQQVWRCDIELAFSMHKIWSFTFSFVLVMICLSEFLFQRWRYAQRASSIRFCVNIAYTFSSDVYGGFGSQLLRRWTTPR